MSAQPDFLIIGAMKCATSTLHEQLAAQPGIFMSEPKEPNFFSDPDEWARGWNWYTDLFASGEGALLRGESSTHYTKLPTYPETVERIRAHLPAARFVYVMRSPLERTVSQYIHEWTERRIRGSIDEAIEQHPYLVAYSCYAMQLRPYLEAFGPDRVLSVFFEAILERPREELARIARFLRYPHEAVWLDDLNPRNVSRERMRRSPLRDAIVDQPALAWLRRNLVPRSLRERAKSLWRMTERPELSAPVRRRVVERIDEDLVELSSWLGVELRCANFAEIAAGAPRDWTAAAPGRRP